MKGCESYCKSYFSPAYVKRTVETFLSVSYPSVNDKLVGGGGGGVDWRGLRF